MIVRRGLSLLERPNEVEASLWRRLRSQHDESCREQLFHLYLPLARALAVKELRRRPSYGLERADFEHLAVGGLLEAIDRYDPLRGAPFDAFARYRIRGAITDGLARSSERGAQYAFRRRLETERVKSLQAPEDSSKDSLQQLTDIAAALAIGFLLDQAAHNARAGEGPGYESRTWRELQQSVLQEVTGLPEKERSIIEQHYINGVAFNDIATLLNLTKGRISQLHRSAILRMRERLRRFD